jgi:hypothetical protein
LKSLVAFKLVLEAKRIFLVCEFQEVEKLCGCFYDGKWRRLGVVDEGRNAAVGIQTQEPPGLLSVVSALTGSSHAHSLFWTLVLMLMT